MLPAKNLAQEPPISPRVRLRNYAVLNRTIDKCRAFQAGTIGEYHFNCPLDQKLFEFKHIAVGDFEQAVQSANAYDDVALWFDQAGTPRSEAEIVEWSDSMESQSMRTYPEKADWFRSECLRVGINSESSTLFDLLEADDALLAKPAAL